MGTFGGSKSKSVSGPATYTTPYVQGALEQVQGVVGANQGKLENIGDAAIGAYNAIAPSAFGANNFLTGAQNTASGLAANAGQAYSGFGQGNPASGYLINAANGNGGVAPYMIGTSQVGTGQVRSQGVGTGSDDAVAGGKYLNAQPSAGLYGDIIGGSQLNGNPYLQQIIDSTNASVGTAANRQFAARGLGAGISTPYANIVSKNLAASEGNLRYQNYNDAANRQLTAAGQSDAAFANERGYMDNASGRILAAGTTDANNALSASQANAANQLAASQANASNSLAANTSNAANGLTADQFNSKQAFDAATGLGQLYNDSQALGLNAQQSADQTRLGALGLTPGLVNAQYAGVDPALSLLNSAAGIPYTGVNALAGNVANLTGATNTTTSTSKGPGLGYSVWTAAAGSAGAASDRRLKKNIERVGELSDGLGVYDFDYIHPSFGEGRQRGVMAEEVAQLRPWALGAKIGGEFATVHYDKLGEY